MTHSYPAVFITEFAVDLNGQILPANTREGAEDFAKFHRSIGDKARVLTRTLTREAWRCME